MTRHMKDTRAGVALSDGVVTLRPWQTEDAAAIFAAIEESRPELQHWLPGAGGIASVADVRDYIELTVGWRDSGVAYDFVISATQTGDVLGGCGLTQINRNHRFANLYYWVRTGSTGRGLARRAIRLAARFGLEGLGLKRVEIVVQPGNSASLNAATGAGAVREALLRNRLTVNEVTSDAVMFSLIPEDFA